MFNIVFTPTNNAATGEAMYGGGEAVLASIATIGVQRVSSVCTNTVVAVPWKSMSIGTEVAREVTANEVVNQNGLSAGDLIVSYNAASGSFAGWKNAGENGWEALATLTTNGVSLVPAATAQLPRGNAFWLARSAPSGYFYLVGRYDGGEYEVVLEVAGGDEAGNTLCANPTMEDVDLNDIEFIDGDGNPATPDKDDRITIQDAQGHGVDYFRNAANTQWGRDLPKGRRKVFTPGGTVPAGTGFWYKRAGGGVLKMRFGK